MEFKTSWGGPLIRPEAGALAALKLPSEARSFLAGAGLPAAPEPRLAFDFPGGRVPLLAEISTAALPLADAERARYLRIGGFPGAYFCIDPEDGRIVQVFEATEHEEAAAQFVNSSLPQLGECLLAYRDVMGEALAREAAASRASIDDAARHSALPAAERAALYQRLGESREVLLHAMKQDEQEAHARLAALREAIARIDAAALGEEAFWAGVLMA